MNLGQLARTEYLGALALVKEMEPEFKMAGELDPQFDHAGPKRNLGLLYRDCAGLAGQQSAIHPRRSRF